MKGSIRLIIGLLGFVALISNWCPAQWEHFAYWVDGYVFLSGLIHFSKGMGVNDE